MDNRSIACLGLTAMVCACTYTVDIKNVPSDVRLSLQCFPGESDTILVQANVAYPLNWNGGPISRESLLVQVHAGDSEVELERDNKGRLFFTRELFPDERISLCASAENVTPASAQTRLPADYPSFDYSFYEKNGLRVKLEIKDESSSENWYGFRVYRRSIHREDHHYGKHSKIETIDLARWETVGSHEEAPEEMQTDRMITDYVGWSQMTLFPDEDAVGGKIERTIIIPGSTPDYYGVITEFDTISYQYYYKLEVYSISKEMFRFFETKYQIEHNDLASAGIAPASFVYSNVQGGYGVLAGCLRSGTDWIPNPLGEYTPSDRTSL